jgi:hypothetical protein
MPEALPSSIGQAIATTEAIVRLADETGCKVATSGAACYRDGSYRRSLYPATSFKRSQLFLSSTGPNPLPRG